MNTATVTVAYVNPVAPGKKMGSIKLDDGSFYSVSPTMLSQFQPKGKYEVTYESHDFNGKTYRTVKTVKALAAPNGATAAAPSGGRYGATDPGTSENIFVCGVMNALAGAGQLEVSVETVANMTFMLRMGWRRGLTPATTPAQTRTKEQSQDEMNDEIPF